MNQIDILSWRAELFRDSFDDKIQNAVSESEVDIEQMGQQELYHFVELHDFIQSLEEFKVLGFDGDTEWKFILALVNTVIDTEVDDVSVLCVLI